MIEISLWGMFDLLLEEISKLEFHYNKIFKRENMTRGIVNCTALVCRIKNLTRVSGF